MYWDTRAARRSRLRGYIIGGIRYLFYTTLTVKTINFTGIIDSNTPWIRTSARYYIGCPDYYIFFSQITHTEYVTRTIEAPKWRLLLYEGRPHPITTPPTLVSHSPAASHEKGFKALFKLRRLFSTNNACYIYIIYTLLSSGGFSSFTICGCVVERGIKNQKIIFFYSTIITKRLPSYIPPQILGIL